MPTTEKQLKEVTPIQTVEKDGKEYAYQYSFSEVHIDEIDGVDMKNVEMGKEGAYLTWQYGDKPKLYISRNAVFVEEDASEAVGNSQAYYALSVLAGKGKVSRWGR